MNFKETFFSETNFVGREVENIQEVVKGMAASMDFANVDGAGYTYEEYHESDDEHDDDYYTQPTEEEIFDRIKEDLDKGQKVYVGMFISCRDYSIVPKKPTTLQSDFYVRQLVYIIQDNQITKAQVYKVQMVRHYNGSTIGTEIKYEVRWSKSGRTYSAIVSEGNIFASIEKLTEHLTSNIIG